MKEKTEAQTRQKAVDSNIPVKGSVVRVDEFNLPNSSYYVGVVEKVGYAPDRGYEMVYYRPHTRVQVDRNSGKILSKEKVEGLVLRCPVNGIPTILGGETNFVKVVE